jgi:hypothetical protein
MSETVTFPAPVLPPSPPAPSKWEREQRAFVRMLPALLAKYRGKFVAVHDEQVVDSDDDLIALALRVYAKHGYVPIYMDLVTDQPRRVERVGHYRSIRSAAKNRSTSPSA